MSDTAAAPDVGDDDVLKGIAEATKAAQRTDVALTYLGAMYFRGVMDRKKMEDVLVHVGIISGDDKRSNVALDLAGEDTDRFASVYLDPEAALVIANRLERAATILLDAASERVEAEADVAGDGPRWPGREDA